MNIVKISNGRYQLDSGIWITKAEMLAQADKEKSQKETKPEQKQEQKKRIFEK